ncbi:PP2C family protein-serine/threonine phosphatase [Anaerolactibacter massiliensis]|uniref:PP2C family protein-serine/threonine phosphatase n=1 Tax=Anaerolactibacter massiliensis TaxID=2044573 RepID=UPI000CF98C35|nr:PP2C family serine/threonine-protein phosphatase [Anaerolactibacter massiliensis]
MRRHFTAVVESDRGLERNVNQDSALIKHAFWKRGEVLLAAVCDGMGGLADGELASGEAVHVFDEWFSKALPYEVEEPDFSVIGAKWSSMLKDLNERLNEYGKKTHELLGTTFTGILGINDSYVIVHVGDSRIYRLSSTLNQVSEDHTFVQREVEHGRMSSKEAAVDSRRNVLTQSIGSSRKIAPQVVCGTFRPEETWLICSDGFRHCLEEQEILEALDYQACPDEKAMQQNCRKMIALNRRRGEKDDITALLIKVD